MTQTEIPPEPVPESAPGPGPGASPGATVQWLTDEEQDAWRNYFFASRMLEDCLGDVLEHDAAIDLTLAEYDILVKLSESTTRAMRMSELADAVVHSRSRAAHTVARLEKRGLVRRVHARDLDCTSDGRGRVAVLEDSGMETLVRAAPIHVQSVRDHLLDVLGHDDFLELGRLMGRVREHQRDLL